MPASSPTSHFQAPAPVVISPTTFPAVSSTTSSTVPGWNARLAKNTFHSPPWLRTSWTIAHSSINCKRLPQMKRKPGELWWAAIVSMRKPPLEAGKTDKHIVHSDEAGNDDGSCDDHHAETVKRVAENAFKTPCKKAKTGQAPSKPPLKQPFIPRRPVTRSRKRVKTELSNVPNWPPKVPLEHCSLSHGDKALNVWASNAPAAEFSLMVKHLKGLVLHELVYGLRELIMEKRKLDQDEEHIEELLQHQQQQKEHPPKKKKAPPKKKTTKKRKQLKE
ncbi:hypothetical protein U9M48_030248 [Paspalum notatum var. saurae]|uniref:Uncharacterized protein n=1 Tax=Paspalum notatum var. saurae TaxID=547442 RepID=A0AAQ3X330_PASNO